MDSSTLYKGRPLSQYTKSELSIIEAAILDKSKLRWSLTEKLLIKYIQSCK